MVCQKIVLNTSCKVSRTLNSSTTEFLLIGIKQQLSKIHDSSLTTTHSDRNLGFIFDEHLTFSDQISALSKSCYCHIRELRCIGPYLNFETASTIAILRAIPNQVPNFRPNWAIRGGVMT